MLKRALGAILGLWASIAAAQPPLPGYGDFNATSYTYVSSIIALEVPLAPGILVNCTTPGLSCLNAVTGPGLLQPYAFVNTGTGNDASANGFSASLQSLFLCCNYTGSGAGPFVEISVSDAAGNPTAGTALAGLRIDYNTTASMAAGNRTVLQPIMNFNNATAGTNNQLKSYNGSFPQIYVNSGDGGTSGHTLGNFYGHASLCQASSAATFIESCGSYEADISNKSTSIDLKYGITIANVNSDTTRGVLGDYGLVFVSDGSGPATWKYGISFGRYDGAWMFASDSTLIAATTPLSGSMVANGGIDFSLVTFTTFAMKTPGATLDNVGNFFAQAITTSGASAGIAMSPRGGSGNTYQWYNPSGNYLALFNGSGNAITFGNGSHGAAVNYLCTDASHNAFEQAAAC